MSNKEEEHLGRSYFALVAGGCASAASFFGKLSGEIDGASNLVWHSSFKCKHFEFIIHFLTQPVLCRTGPEKKLSFILVLHGPLYSS